MSMTGPRDRLEQQFLSLETVLKRKLPVEKLWNFPWTNFSILRQPSKIYRLYQCIPLGQKQIRSLSLVSMLVIFQAFTATFLLFPLVIIQF